MTLPQYDRPLRTPTGRVVLGLLILAFLALLGTNVTTFLMINRVSETNAQIDRIYEVRGDLRDLLASALEAEAGQRGFLLTGRVAYLSVHDQAVERTPGLLDQLEQQTRSDPAQQRRVRQLRMMFRDRFGTIRTALDLYIAHRPDEARAFLEEADQRGVPAKIRGLLNEFEAAEGERLHRRTQRQAREVERTVWVNGLAGSLILLAAGVSLVLINRYLATIDASRRELDRVNRGLEETVLERTEDLLRANDELAVARDRAEALLREVNHRVGNSLQLVSSMISLQSKALPDKAAREALRTAQARIEAVAQVHRRLYTSATVGKVSLDDYLQNLIDELRQSLPVGFHDQIELKADPLEADTDRAVSLGVIAAELVTNAVKYAYRGKPGPIRVRLLDDGEGHALLMVEDDGLGMDGGPPKGTGLGAKILKSMAASIGSKVEYERRPRGVRALMRFEYGGDD
jgi:two-component sensor histidine kinase